MYLLKSWRSDDVFNMLLNNQPVDFDEACRRSLDSGDMTVRLRERIRNYQLVKPVLEKINKELKLFDEQRAEDGESKTRKATSGSEVTDSEPKSKKAKLDRDKIDEDKKKYVNDLNKIFFH